MARSLAAGLYPARMTLGILLAAGLGRRMGRPKALLELGGRTAAARCAEALRAGGCDELVVVLSPAAQAAAAGLPPGTRVLTNPDPESGQTASLKLALAGGPGAGAAFVLHTVDHPLLRAGDVRALLDALAAAPRARVALPLVGTRRGHPAACAAGLAAEFLALGDDEPAHLVMRRDPARVLLLPREDEWLVRDLDTPADLDAARAALAARGAQD